jgi:hypothetical protein
MFAREKTMCALSRFLSVVLAVGGLVIGGRGVLVSTEPPKETALSAAGLVRSALEAELRGDFARRKALLKEARRVDPDEASARWHGGWVALNGEWRTVEEAESLTAAEGKVQTYRTLRERCAGTLAGQIQLARWCRRNAWEELEKWHWMRVLTQNPMHPQARSRLGARQCGGLLLTGEQYAAYQDWRDQAETAERTWTPRVRAWARAIGEGTAGERDAAFDEVRNVADAQAIPFLESAVSTIDADAALAVIVSVAKMGGQAATDSLVRHAVLAESLQARRAAATALKDRSWYSYVPGLLGNLKSPLEMQYHALTLSNGASYGFTIEREGPTAFVSQSWAHRSIRQFTEVYRKRGRTVTAFETVLPDPQTARQGRSEMVRLRRLVNESNATEEAFNDLIYEVLEIATGQQLKRRPQSWWKWWQEYNELASAEEKPLLSQRLATFAFQRTGRQTGLVEFKAVPGGQQPTHRVQKIMLSCFLPGTQVWTNTGAMSIEKIRPGDYVLSQNAETGEVAYRLVLQTMTRPPSPTLRIGVGDEEIAATPGHPLWVVGEGWRMAKELVEGQRLHGLRGGMPIKYIEAGPNYEAHNLVVADHHSYFVGKHRLLAHDNRTRKATNALLPGYTADGRRER